MFIAKTLNNTTTMTGILNLWATEIENVGRSWATNVIICFFHHYVLEIVAAWKFPHSLTCCTYTDNSCCHGNEM